MQHLVAHHLFDRNELRSKALVPQTHRCRLGHLSNEQRARPAQHPVRLLPQMRKRRGMLVGALFVLLRAKVQVGVPCEPNGGIAELRIAVLPLGHAVRENLLIGATSRPESLDGKTSRPSPAHRHQLLVYVAEVSVVPLVQDANGISSY
eukprot:1375655-Amorphochlora_amoeboformis.AAC.1